MIFGHKKQREYLKKLAERKMIPHALLFTGMENLGKKEVAMEFASLVLGGSPFQHPDFFFLESFNRKIQIEQIRELINKISLTPMMASFKLAIIDQAHLMTTEAQSCLLKTLEEPKRAILILISHLPKMLLPTIISRCQTVKFFPLKKEELKEILKEKKLDEETMNKILEISLGRPKIASFLSENLERLERYEKIEKALEILKEKSIYSRFRFIEKILKEISLLEFLDLLVTIGRKNAIIKGEEKYFSFLKEVEKLQILNAISKINEQTALEILFLKI